MMTDEQGIRGLLNRYIPRAILESGGIEAVLRARVLMGLFISNLCIIFMVFIVLAGMTLFAGASVKLGLVATGLAIGVLLLELALFYGVGNVIFSGAVFSIVYFVSTLATVVFTGAWDSPILQLFFCSPAVAFLTCGRKSGIATATLVFFSGIILVMGEGSIYTGRQVIQEQNFELIRLLIWVASIVLLMSCFAVYDSLVEKFTHFSVRTR